MPFEREPTYPGEGKKREKVPEERVEAITEIPTAEEEGQKEKKISDIQREIEEMREKESEERKAEEMREEKERKLETIKELVRESLPEKFGDLVGDDSEEAWRKREKLVKKEPMYMAATLAGAASEKSRRRLNEIKEIRKTWWGISRGLIGDDSEEAWQIREYLKFDEKTQRLRGGRWASFLKKLNLHKSKQLFNIRGKIKILGWYMPGDVVISTMGLKSERAWELRKELEDLAPAEVLISLAGDNSPEAWEIRKKYENDPRLNWAYKKSLIGIPEKDK